MNAGPPREEHLLDEVVGITFIVLLFSAIIVHHYLFPLKPSKFVRLSPIHFGSTLIFASCAIHLPLVLTDVFSFGYVRLLWILPACRVITNNKNIIKIGMVATTRYCIRPSCQGSGLLLFVSVYSDILVTSSSSKSSPIINDGTNNNYIITNSCFALHRVVMLFSHTVGFRAWHRPHQVTSLRTVTVACVGGD